MGREVEHTGAKLGLREARRSDSGGELFVSYEMHATGMPPELLYGIFSLVLPAKEPTEFLSGVTIGPEGRVCMADELKHCFPFPTVIAFQPAKGEPLMLSLISTDGKYKAFVSVVPSPISGEDKGCQITVTRLSPGFEIALVEGRGFPANSELAWQSNSSGESLSAKIKTDENGVLTPLAFLPFVKGKKQGTNVVTVFSDRCKPTASFEWGPVGK